MKSITSSGLFLLLICSPRQSSYIGVEFSIGIIGLMNYLFEITSLHGKRRCRAR